MALRCFLIFRRLPGTTARRTTPPPVAAARASISPNRPGKPGRACREMARGVCPMFRSLQPRPLGHSQLLRRTAQVCLPAPRLCLVHLFPAAVCDAGRCCHPGAGFVLGWRALPLRRSDQAEGRARTALQSPVQRLLVRLVFLESLGPGPQGYRNTRAAEGPVQARSYRLPYSF